MGAMAEGLRRDPELAKALERRTPELELELERGRSIEKSLEQSIGSAASAAGAWADKGKT